MSKAIGSEELGIKGAGTALKAVAAACTALDTSFLLVGALARDILFHHLRGVERPRRLTRDVDVAVAVEGWEAFQRLVDRLVTRHDFKKTPVAHRFRAPERLIVDMIPFGGVEDETHHVRWPPEHEVAMSVLGFREAMQAAEAISIDGVEVAVISLRAFGPRAFGPLKLLAWEDRRRATQRDAEDFCFVLTSYLDAEQERVLDAHADLFAAEGGDQVYVGARAYGREVASFVGQAQALQVAIVEMLDRETRDIEESDLALAILHSRWGTHACIRMSAALSAWSASTGASVKDCRVTLDLEPQRALETQLGAS